ncbi:hypothetical protein IGH98_07570 [Bacillus thuringiensis]|nr:hypothetical protein [Bacillus thuringiensis]
MRLRFRLSPPLVATILINYIIDNKYLIGEVIKGIVADDFGAKRKSRRQGLMYFIFL